MRIRSKLSAERATRSHNGTPCSASDCIEKQKRENQPTARPTAKITAVRTSILRMAAPLHAKSYLRSDR